MIKSLFLLLALMMSLSSLAHEIRPAFLALSEVADNEFSVVWKRPIKAGLTLNIQPRFPDHCTLNYSPLVEVTGQAKLQHGRLVCASPALNEGVIHVEGLTSTIIDVLLRIEWLDGKSYQVLLTPSESSLTLSSDPQYRVSQYIWLGVEHILAGYDHLLFVLALLLIISGKMALFKTITAFTFAHSITLALATLGFLSVPSTPVEAIIALSIAWMAAEAIYKRRGLRSFTVQYPWLVAFIFGLLHGLGFAGALAEVGLPDGDIPLALLLFNLGIEAGQIFVVMVVLSLLALLRYGLKTDLQKWSYVPAYCIGGLGMYWGLQRIAGMF